jgi:hypothetical protein
VPNAQLIEGFYNLPEIIIPKVFAKDLLAILRLRINDQYMPSAKGITNTTCNSKPDYVKYRDPIHSNFPAFIPPMEHEPNCYYVLVDEFGFGLPDGKVFLNLSFSNFQMMIDLHSEEIMVRAVAGNMVSNIFIWDQTRPLPLDLTKFGVDSSFYL